MKRQATDYSGRLSKNDEALFHKLWFGLLNFVNETVEIDKNVGQFNAFSEDILQIVLPIRMYVVNHPEIIDEYITSSYSEFFTEEEKGILLDFKRGIDEKLLLLKAQKKRALFLYPN
jgi:hypothetical protein